MAQIKFFPQISNAQSILKFNPKVIDFVSPILTVNQIHWRQSRAWGYWRKFKMLDCLKSLLGKKRTGVHAKVEIYTWQTCPYCIAAKLLLFFKGVHFTEYKIDGDEDARNKMAERAEGQRTVPQIFIDNVPIGGCTDLFELDRKGELKTLLHP